VCTLTLLIAVKHRRLPVCPQGDKHKRVALSLHIARLTGAAGLDALQPGVVVPAAVKAVEDHGYSLSFGIKVGCMPGFNRQPGTYGRVA
jgi:hypothetical protein